MDSVITIGELLIDFICSDINVDLTNGNNFIKKAGGAPANVCATITKLGGKASFVGNVGNDHFGVYLEQVLKEYNVDTSMLRFDNDFNTTLAFVSLKDDGERDFIFNRGADANLKYADLNLEKIIGSKIVHFGSATALLGGDIKDCYLNLLKQCKKEDIYISFDPNYRIDLWKGRDVEFIEVSKKCIEFADFVKFSEEEIFLITNMHSIEQAVKSIHALGAKLVAVTLGSRGTFISDGTNQNYIDSIKVEAIDSTGAGDSFVGAVLFEFSKLDNIHKEVEDFNKIRDIVSFANKVAAIVCTKYGAIEALPSFKEVST